MKLYPTPPARMEAADRGGGPAAEGVPGKRPVFSSTLHSEAEEGVFPKPACSHTCACISNKPPMDS